MKKIIRGRLYDTDTAKEIANWENDAVTPSDFHYYTETLYRKKTGEFFVYGEGGPASKYAERVFGGYQEGCDIRPLTYEDAREWAEKKMYPDEYLKWFQVSDDIDTKETVTIRLSHAAIDKLRMAASQKDTTSSDIIETLIADMDLK